jgi:hypothetical protein
VKSFSSMAIPLNKAGIGGAMGSPLTIGVLG